MLHTRRPLLATFFFLGTLLPISYVKSEHIQSRLSPTRIQEASTCPSQSVNHITQTLPQQCLTSNWSAQSGSRSSSYPNASANSTAIEITDLITQGISTTGRKSPPTLKPTVSLSTGPLSSGTSAEIAASVVESKYSATTLPAPYKDETLPREPTSLEHDNEIDPLSDDSNFLSFEEWKSRMLEKAGQSSEHIGAPRQAPGRTEFQREPANLNNALDSLGEDTEIELDFSGFASADTTADLVTPNIAKNSEKNADGHGKVADQFSKKSKDAGKTCKERFNYASFDCAATVLKTNPECKGSTAVLVENKDSYMLNECSAKNKFFIVELCNDILIDTVVLGNFEFFSSTFQKFRVSVSDRYPVKLDKWKTLGTFEARNTREVQAFLVENPLIWARYLRIEFLTHYGNEYYCPVSLLRIHGKTMMDDYRHDVKAARGDEDVDEDVSEIEDDTNKGEPSTISADVLRHQTQSDAPSQASTPPSTTISITLEPSPNTLPVGGVTVQTSSKSAIGSTWFTYKNPLYEQQQLLSSNCAVGKFSCDLEFIKALGTPSSVTSSSTNVPLTSSAVELIGSKTTSNIGALNLSATASLPTSVVMASNGSHQSVGINKTQNLTTSTPVSTKSSANYSSQINSRLSTQSPSPSPTTQESFFKSIHKRLQLLESNSTLSLQYIEEQSRILREAFTKVEKRQLLKTTTFLDTLNTTVLNELRDFQHQYDQIWQSTVLELSAQREQSQREIIALSARLSILADELLFQKRMAIIQFLLIVLCLGLAIFSRAAPSSPAYLELQSTVQNMVSKPSARFSRYLHVESPPESPSRRSSRYGFFSRTINHIRSPSNDSTMLSDGRKSPCAEFSPPTPISSPSDDDREESVSPEASLPLRRTVSDTAVPTAQHGNENDELRDDAKEMEDGMADKTDDPG